MLKPKRPLAAGLVTALLLIAFAPIALADTTPQAQEAASQTYASDNYLQRGTIITLKANDSKKVVPATAATLNQMLGVVVSVSDSPLTLTGSDATAKTYVATSGRYNVLVTNQNGPIKAGDYVTVSALDGIGMKTGTVQGLVLGTAAGNFNGTNDALTTTDLKDVDNKIQKVSIGIIQVDINIGQNPFLYHGTGGVPKTLNLISQAISGKPVSAVRVYSGSAVMLAAISLAASLLYSGIRGSFVAIGRNPLARRTIIRGMIQVIVTALIIFTFGLLGVYLILKL